ncbi:uncharacterized protein ACA1_270300 [Acanthamoeba castellanii str. Neff]|uniref:Uncharacterized protein n=1 Tax=Acanthamoeba castellanii (strain ATCC 30010 / Neff) TaxID=1257118 RepID=L8H2X6_ACACF|nr:uncharacterized protein ACA1_270300 [Acanthamoeba castellanii str. Neff]ELR19555.1 hypothetical protein ACA1_270300 [Acanthamoeba castellanii str. Neff]
MHRPLVFCLVVVLLAIAASSSAVPRKPVWPRQFDVQFGLSVVESPLNGPIVNVTSHFYYDFNVQASLVTYPELCLPGLIPGDGWKKGCNLLFNPKGTYLFAPHAGVDCCLLFPGVGTVPPDFLRGFNASGFVVPTPDLYGVLHNSDFWVTNEGFFYWTDAKTGGDVALVDGGSVVWNFYPHLRVAPQPSALFAVPSNCAVSCPGSFLAHARKHAGGRVDPMVSLALHHHRLLHTQ